jgi:hypothetical protein
LPDLLKDEWFICNDIVLIDMGKGKNVANTRTLNAISGQLVAKIWVKMTQLKG